MVGATLEVLSGASGCWSGSSENKGAVVWIQGAGKSAWPGRILAAADGTQGGGLGVSEEGSSLAS